VFLCSCVRTSPLPRANESPHRFHFDRVCVQTSVDKMQPAKSIRTHGQFRVYACEPKKEKEKLNALGNFQSRCHEINYLFTEMHDKLARLAKSQSSLYYFKAKCDTRKSANSSAATTTASTEAIAMSVQCIQAICVLYTQTDFHAKIYQPNQHPESLASVLRKCFLISFCPALVKTEA